MSIKDGDAVPLWLQQRYKSKWKQNKQTKEQKEEKKEAQAKEREEKKRKHFEDAQAELLQAVQQCPPQDVKLQDKRDWGFESPRETPRPVDLAKGQEEKQ